MTSEGETPRAEGPQYVLRLFITGATPRSVRAIANLRRVCDEHLKGAYDLEVVDLYQDPDAAKNYQIIAAPTLVKMLPLPLRKIIGDLADDEKVLAGLDLAPKNTQAHLT